MWCGNGKLRRRLTDGVQVVGAPMRGEMGRPSNGGGSSSSSRRETRDLFVAAGLLLFITVLGYFGSCSLFIKANYGS
jgi:hypothetical protein